MTTVLHTACLEVSNIHKTRENRQFSFLKIYIIKHHDLKQLGEERLYFSLQFHIMGYLRREQDRSSKQESWGRYWSINYKRILLTGLLFMTWSACFFLAPRTTSPQVAQPTKAYALSYQLSTKKMLPRLTQRPIWWGTFY